MCGTEPPGRLGPRALCAVSRLDFPGNSGELGPRLMPCALWAQEGGHRGRGATQRPREGAVGARVTAVSGLRPLSQDSEGGL